MFGAYLMGGPTSSKQKMDRGVVSLESFNKKNKSGNFRTLDKLKRVGDHWNLLEGHAWVRK